jgi:non-specific protein-tyrosine kinase
VADAFVPLEQERQGTARYLAAFREHWLLIAILTVTAVASAAIYSSTATKRYEASTDLLITPIPADDPTYVGIDVLRESTDPQARVVLTVAQLIQTPEVAREVEQKIGGAALLDSLEVRPVSQSNVLTLVGKADDPSRAAAIANTFADVLVEQRTDRFQESLSRVISILERRLQAVEFGSIEAERAEERLATLRPLVGTQEPTLEITSRAVPPSSPVWPRPKLSIAVALLAALLLGSGISLGLELLTPRVKREDELLLDHRLPVLARVPRLPTSIAKGYLTRHEPLPGDVWESYRTLRASLVATGEGSDMPRTILVTSAMPGEGKTMTAVNLSVTMALAGMRVILVDGDLRRPMVAPVFGVAASREGFASLLLGKSDANLVPAPGHGDRLRLLLASPEHAHLIDLLEPRRVKRALDELATQADVVIVDSPPLGEVADALPLADEVDAVIVAVRLGYTRRDRLADLRRMLAQQGVSPIGFVVTTLRAPRGRGYYAYRSTMEQRSVTELPAAVVASAAAPSANAPKSPELPSPAASPEPRRSVKRVEAPGPDLDAREQELARRQAAIEADRQKVEAAREAIEKQREQVNAQAAELRRAEEARREVELREAELEAERQAVEEQRSEAATARTEVARRQAELDQEHKRNEAARKELAQEARKQAESTSRDLTKREKEMAAERKRVEAERAELARRQAEVDAERKRSEASWKELEQNQEQLEARRAELEKAAATAAELEKRESEIEAERRRVEASRGELAHREAEIEQERRRLDAERSELETQVARREQEVDAERRRTEALRAELVAERRRLAEARATAEQSEQTRKDALRELAARAAAIEQREARLAGLERKAIERTSELEQEAGDAEPDQAPAEETVHVRPGAGIRARLGRRASASREPATLAGAETVLAVPDSGATISTDEVVDNGDTAPADGPPSAPEAPARGALMAFDMNLKISFNSVSDESAERFARDLAAYIQGLYQDQIQVEDVQVDRSEKDAEHVGTQ